MTNKTITLTPVIYQYLLDHSLHEPAVLTQLRKETATLPNGHMQISPDQAQFMSWLVQLMNAKKTIDVGTFTGYSALTVALALPSDGKVIACDVNAKTTEMAKQFWQQAGVADKIHLHLAPAELTLLSLIDNGEAGTFDFIFIDADKANYKTYYELSLQLLREGGVVAIDNVLWSGLVADDQANDKATRSLRDFNDHIYHDARVSITLLPIGDGLTLARKISFP